jgi:Mce-associated membrane protein
VTVTELKPDEKVCPYCAEVIKAQAVRCRWCRADLTEASAATDQAPEDAPAEGPTEVPEERVPFWAGARLFGVLLGALAGLLVVVVVLVLSRGREPAVSTTGPDAAAVQLADPAARDAALSAATKLTEATLSYKWNTLAADRRKAEAGMTAEFRRQYEDAMGTVDQQTRHNQVVLRADVVAAGLVSADQHQARVLAFTNQSTTTKDSDTPRIDQNRVLVTLTRADGDWRLSAMSAF